MAWYCPHCDDQVHSSGYFEIYHAGDGTPVCNSDKDARERRKVKAASDGDKETQP